MTTKKDDEKLSQPYCQSEPACDLWKGGSCHHLAQLYATWGQGTPVVHCQHRKVKGHPSQAELNDNPELKPAHAGGV